ncbi:hypothetical protein VP01_3778g4 [Puccinia sorghi]|uniref:Uncharacterized protein n=1 Tax=Puccinia sorghi TaxID=27349 RepID=A0A0L6UTM2_9BASI|nr:hypothetical protein VP01_3778g4 [Puccinia sorghi]
MPEMSTRAAPMTLIFKLISALTSSFRLCHVLYCLVVSILRISQAKCREAVVYIIYLIKKFLHLPPDVEMETKIPRDVRTITKHLKLKPEIELHVCCIKFYLLYDIETSTFQCGYKATPQSPVCGTDFFSGAKFLPLNRIPQGSTALQATGFCPCPKLKPLSMSFLKRMLITIL